MFTLFIDRSDAGQQLAAKLLDDPLIKKAARSELLVLSIPRGGVMVGAAVAQALGCAHEVVAVKKIGFPGREELAIGAMAEDGATVLNQGFLRLSSLEDDYLEQKMDTVKAQIEGYIQKFRHGRALDVAAKTVIVVDDGIATGETMKAVVTWLHSRTPAQRPKQVVVAAPVCSPSAARAFKKLVNKFICLAVPDQFWAVGQFYWDFDQVTDEEVEAYLTKNTGVESQPVKISS